MVRRIILAVIGGLLILAGVASGVVAAWGYTSIGSDGVVHLPIGTVSPDESARAAIVDVGTFAVSAPYVGSLGRSELVVTSATPGRTVFVGAAATPAADAYLAGVPYSAAFREGDAWSVRSVPGGQPLPAPASGPWLAQATGASAGISVPEQRPLSLVVADPTGEPVGAFDLAVAFRIPDASSWLLGLAIAAGVLIVAGGVLLFLGLRRRRALGKHAAGQATAEDPTPAEDTLIPDDEATAETTELPVVSVDGSAPDDVTTQDVATEEAVDEVVDGVAFVIEVEGADDAAPDVDVDDAPEPMGPYGDIEHGRQ